MYPQSLQTQSPCQYMDSSSTLAADFFFWPNTYNFVGTADDEAVLPWSCTPDPRGIGAWNPRHTLQPSSSVNKRAERMRFMMEFSTGSRLRSLARQWSPQPTTNTRDDAMKSSSSLRQQKQKRLNRAKASVEYVHILKLTNFIGSSVRCLVPKSDAGKDSNQQGYFSSRTVMRPQTKKQLDTWRPWRWYIY
jgi:hypothetical protein